MIAGMIRNKQDEKTEKDLVTLPLTHQELLVVMRCLGVAGESERTDPADKDTIVSIRQGIARFAERQGAWWDTP